MFIGYKSAVAHMKSQRQGLIMPVLDKIKQPSFQRGWGGAHDVLSPCEKLLAVGG